jgi:hypothetical protein
MKASEYQIRQGGLFRCCLLTLEETELSDPPEEGDTITCSYCGQTMSMNKGSWGWDEVNGILVPACP